MGQKLVIGPNEPGATGFTAVADGAIAAGKAVTIEAGTGKVKQVAAAFYNAQVSTTVSATYNADINKDEAAGLISLGSDKWLQLAAPNNQADQGSTHNKFRLGSYNGTTLTMSSNVSPPALSGTTTYVGSSNIIVDGANAYGLMLQTGSSTGVALRSIKVTSTGASLAYGSSHHVIDSTSNINRFTQGGSKEVSQSCLHTTATSGTSHSWLVVSTCTAHSGFTLQRNGIRVTAGAYDTATDTITGGTSMTQLKNASSADNNPGMAICVPVAGVANKFIVGYVGAVSCEGNGYNDAYIYIATVSGTSVSLGTGSRIVIASGGQYAQRVFPGSSLGYDSTNNKYLFMTGYRTTAHGSGGTQVTSFTCDTSANTISMAAPIEFAADWQVAGFWEVASKMYGHGMAMWDADNSRFVIIYNDANHSGTYEWNASKLTYRTLTPTYGSNSYVLGSKVIINNNTSTQSSAKNIAIGVDSTRKRILASVPLTGFWMAGLAETSNVEQWVGIAEATVADGATVAVTLPGGTNANQSGMTIEGTYYVQDDGDIETGVTTEVAGVALSATQLLVADNTANVGSFATSASSATKANIASPTFTGTPAAPTAAVGTNTTQVATTAFVLANAGSTTYTAISSATTAVAGNAYIVDTGAAVTVTLPASAAIGDTVAVIDGTGTAATNNITIGRNSHKIQGDAADMTVSLNRAAFELVYYNATHGWLLTKV